MHDFLLWLIRHTQRFPKNLRQLDCGLAVDGHSFDTFAPNHAFNYCKTENALVFFLFRLLNQLQSLGAVPAIDWNAYAARLSKRQILLIVSNPSWFLEPLCLSRTRRTITLPLPFDGQAFLERHRWPRG